MQSATVFAFCFVSFAAYIIIFSSQRPKIWPMSDNVNDTQTDFGKELLTKEPKIIGIDCKDKDIKGPCTPIYAYGIESDIIGIACMDEKLYGPCLPVYLDMLSDYSSSMPINDHLHNYFANKNEFEIKSIGLYANFFNTPYTDSADSKVKLYELMYNKIFEGKSIYDVSFSESPMFDVQI